ncbi:MAG: 50S ribosomal protein L25/general stress protein Ctc [bacterium]
MKSISISGSVRQNVGKRDAKELRYEGKVPCVLYGGKEQVHFSVFEADLKHLVYTPEVYFVDLTVDGKKYRATMQDIQFHPLTDLINHIDFLEIDENKQVTMLVPVKFAGSSPGVKMGGKLVHKIKKLKVRGLPKDMTDSIVINIDNLELGKMIRVSEVQVENLTILDAKSNSIVSVETSRALREAAAAEAKEAGKK